MLTIFTISYNSAEVLSKCLGPLIDADVYRVIIIDNASTDGSAGKLTARFPSADVLSMDQNIGYGRAANVALSRIETPYALLLNPDLTASVDEIGKLLSHIEDTPAATAIWGPASKKEDHTQAPPESVEWISGCAMLFDMEKMKTVGFFDEQIFLFFEETDLCTRTHQAGYQIRFCRDVYFDHLEGQACTTSTKVEYMKDWHYGWSRCYYFTKHGADNKKRTPERQHAQYRWKSITATDPRKRRKYKAQADGAKAFLRGTPAFDENNQPRMSPA
jgi:N-acetylglucosaminyl-diphospho-decaprenol L-rhamnosyltransferase